MEASSQYSTFHKYKQGQINVWASHFFLSFFCWLFVTLLCYFTSLLCLVDFTLFHHLVVLPYWFTLMFILFLCLVGFFYYFTLLFTLLHHVTTSPWCFALLLHLVVLFCCFTLLFCLATFVLLLHLVTSICYIVLLIHLATLPYYTLLCRLVLLWLLLCALVLLNWFSTSQICCASLRMTNFKLFLSKFNNFFTFFFINNLLLLKFFHFMHMFYLFSFHFFFLSLFFDNVLVYVDGLWKGFWLLKDTFLVLWNEAHPKLP